MTRLGIVLVLLAGAAWISANPPGGGLTPAYQPSYSLSDDLLKQLLEEVRGIRSELRASGIAKPGGTTLAGTLKANCAACHTAGVADQKGSGFILLEKDGSLAELSLAERRRVAKMVEQGKMPPPPKTLTDTEKKLLLGLKPL